MELQLFKKKFETILKYEHEMPGIKSGLDILRQFNSSKAKESLDNIYDQKVPFYDFIENKIHNYSFVELTESMQELYNQSVLYEKVILYNKLYWIFSDVYDKVYNKYNYVYNKNLFTKFDVINKFFHGLRKRRTSNPLKFFVHQFMTIYTLRYFEEKVTYHEFYQFISDIIIELWEFDVLIYDMSDNSITFNSVYYEDLINLIFLSSNLMTLGVNKKFNYYDLSKEDIESKLNFLFTKYKAANKEEKIYINDLLTSFVISCTVKEISAEHNINNIFIEEIIHGYANK